MGGYTAPSIVKARLGTIDTGVTDAIIEQYIQDAEGTVEAVMRTRKFLSGGAKGAFDATKYKTIQQVTTDLAAYYVVLYNPSTFTLREKVALQVDMLWAAGMRGLSLLGNVDIIKFFEEL